MEQPRDSIRRAKPLLGTFVEIYAAGASPGVLEPAVEAAFGVIAKVHRLMSFHEAGSDVSRLNCDAFGRAVAVDPLTFEVLETALGLQRRSGGIFDVNIAPILQKQGFLPDLPALRRFQHRPAGSRGEPSRNVESHCGSAEIDLLPGRRVRFKSPDVMIDLGGIAKGFAVDCAIKILKERRIPAALVNAGGDLAAFGPATYPVQIRDPREPSRIVCTIALRDGALATSGPRFDPFNASEIAIPAIVDPRTRSTAARIAGASVCAPVCMTADALTKVVMIAGADAGAVLDLYHANALMMSKEGSISFTSGLEDSIKHAA